MTVVRLIELFLGYDLRDALVKPIDGFSSPSRVTLQDDAVSTLPPLF
ncbi:MAG TPA: hypothetical protein V6C65_34290 [Allocoleopsis sp.]